MPSKIRKLICLKVIIKINYIIDMNILILGQGNLFEHNLYIYKKILIKFKIHLIL